MSQYHYDRASLYLAPMRELASQHHSDEVAKMLDNLEDYIKCAFIVPNDSGDPRLFSMIDDILTRYGYVRSIDTRRMTDEEKSLFIRGWEWAGGYTDDGGFSEPWCCPWYWRYHITVIGNNPEQWGMQWWYACRAEINEILREEEEVEEAENCRIAYV